jgi:hypothetical protein
MRRLLMVALTSMALAASGAIVLACSSSSDEAAPSRPVVPVPDASSAADAGDEAEAAPPDAGCAGPAGCFKCVPTKNDEFLNACTDGLCTPFDNAARLPLFKVGQPLPAVP